MQPTYSYKSNIGSDFTMTPEIYRDIAEGNASIEIRTGDESLFLVIKKSTQFNAGIGVFSGEQPIPKHTYLSDYIGQNSRLDRNFLGNNNPFYTFTAGARRRQELPVVDAAHGEDPSVSGMQLYGGMHCINAVDGTYETRYAGLLDSECINVACDRSNNRLKMLTTQPVPPDTELFLAYE